MGLPRAEAQMMAAQTMRGTTGMVLNGEHPAILRDKVSTPGGCTIGGLLVLEEGRVRGTLARAVREASISLSCSPAFIPTMFTALSILQIVYGIKVGRETR